MGTTRDCEAGSSSQEVRKPVPREDTPLLGETKPLSSQTKTFANVFIAVVGAGVLGLPYAFKHTGWLMGVLMIFSVSALTGHCMMLLVYTRRKLETSDNGFETINSFGDLGFVVCGTVGRITVDIMIILSQAGFCVGYLIFMANTLVYLFDRTRILGLSAKGFFIWSCFPFQLGLNSIATLTHLAPLSIFADVVDLGAMALVMIDDVVVFMKHNRPEVMAFGTLSVFFYGIGVAVYCFEGVGMVLPLESEMKKKENFGKILWLSIAFIAVMYGGFGVLGYFAFGNQTKDIITSNLGNGFVSILVQLGLCINLFFTFPLMMHPVYEIVERRFWNGEYCLWLRWLLVLFVSLVALFVPNFTDFLSLVGSSVCCGLGFVLPNVFHLLVFKEEMGWKWWCSDIGIAILGVVLGVSGTWYAVLEIISENN
ncbi:putative Amino acid transporter [Melia azedarach]|uniref:Amino acid transporter n=1 Tax=Melia azedarach TaxID=155640 RepID=A0ACC1XWV6_MELAZ|nr:putative Amino acid transporter [Melia azedarach]